MNLKGHGQPFFVKLQYNGDAVWLCRELFLSLSDGRCRTSTIQRQCILPHCSSFSSKHVFHLTVNPLTITVCYVSSLTKAMSEQPQILKWLHMILFTSH